MATLGCRAEIGFANTARNRVFPPTRDILECKLTTARSGSSRKRVAPNGAGFDSPSFRMNTLIIVLGLAAMAVVLIVTAFVIYFIDDILWSGE